MTTNNPSKHLAAALAASVLLALSACSPDRDAPHDKMKHDGPAQEQTPPDESVPPPASEPETQPEPAPEPPAPPKPEPKPAPAPAPKPIAQAPAPAPAPAPKPICGDCGTVASITAETVKGSGSGAGAVVGGVLGGVLGHQVGGGNGKKLATVAGAVGGALAGNEVEKRAKASTQYRVVINMETGGQQTIVVTDPGSLSVGSKVKVDGTTIVPQ